MLTVRLTDEQMGRIDAECERVGLNRAQLVTRLFERAGVFPGFRPAHAPDRKRDVTVATCPHGRKKKGAASGLVICEDCGTVNP